MIIKYVNSKNQSIDFYGDNLRATEGNFHTRKWKYENDRFLKDKVSYNVTLTLRGSLEERQRKLDEICTIFETDVANNKTGKMYFGDYYLDCCIIASDTHVSNVLVSRTDVVLEIYSTKDWWIKEQLFSFVKANAMAEPQAENEKIYSYSYPYNYGQSVGNENFYYESIKDSEFKMIVYGMVNNPQITINDHLYNVNVELNESEYLVIDSLEKSIYTVSANGTKTNVFNKRNFNSYVFEAIKQGANAVSWSGGFSFDLIVYEERSEPKWL